MKTNQQFDKAFERLILWALILFSYAAFGQTIDIPKAGKWQFVDGTVPPDSVPCQTCPAGPAGVGIVSTVTNPLNGAITFTYSNGTSYTTPPLKGPEGNTPTVTVGTTTIVPYTSPPKVVGVPTPTGIRLDWELPGAPPQPTCPTCPPSGGGTSTQFRHYDAMRDFGAKGDGVTDDTNALQAAINQWMATDGHLTIPSAPNFYKITRQLVMGSPNDNQHWGRLYMQGGAHRGIRYFGPSNSSAVKIYGMKGGSISGLVVQIENGITNTACVDILTEHTSNSTATWTVYDWLLHLGNGTGNSGVRIGKTRAGNGDVSQIAFYNVMIWGGGGANGASISGQNGFEINDGNTCQLSWFGGGGAHLDHVFHLNQGTGFYVYGFGSSNNNIDYWLNYPSTWNIVPNRVESGRQFMVLGGGGVSSITVSNALISNYRPTNGRLFEFNANASIILDGLKVEQTPVAYDQRTVYLGTSSNLSHLTVRGGSWQVPTADFITVANPGRWTLDIKNVGRLDSDFQMRSQFPNR